jgi:hypothetical protein
MSSDDEQKSNLSEQDEQLYEQWLDGIVEEYFFTRDIFLLKAFLSGGGDIDQYGLRHEIADLLGTQPQPNPGGSKDAINIGFYIAVEGRLNSFRPKPNANRDGVVGRTLQEELRSLKKVGKTAAIKEIASEWSDRGRGVSFEGGRSRYEAGKRLFKKKYGKGIGETGA